MNITLLTSCLALATLAGSASANVIFTEDFESPDADPYLSATVPDNGNWLVGDGQFGSARVGLYDESGFDFTTADGSQAFGVWYNNQGGATTSQGAIGAIQNGTYTLTLNVGVATTGNEWNYDVYLLAYDGVADADRDTPTDFGNATILDNVSGATSSTSLSDVVTLTFSLSDDLSVLGQDLAIRLRETNAFGDNTTATLYDNVSLDFVAVPEPSTFALLAGCFGLAWVMVRRRS